MIYYVYEYLREDDTPYYIGMGHGSRIHDPHKGIKLPPRSLRRFVITDISEVDALTIERALTERYGLLRDGTGILANKIHGGHASPRGMLGKKQSDEVKLKISIGNTGKVRTDEHRQNYKGPKSSTHIEKIRQTNIGRPDDGRYTKMAKTKSMHKWFTNGKTTIMVKPGDEPTGFILGRKVAI